MATLSNTLASSKGTSSNGSLKPSGAAAPGKPASSSGKPMRIGKLARLSGKTTRTLHFYEELGLLRPVGRTKGGFRLYDDSAVLRIQWIGRLQELGFSLPEIQDFLNELHEESSGPDAMARLQGFYAEKLEETRSAIARLQELERDLQDSIDYLRGCRACDPLTQRTQCAVCDESIHDGRDAPVMVAAVHEQAPA